jgi:hypothetical protein
MEKLYLFFNNLYTWSKSQPLLYRFTLGTRILLSLAFLPTGVIKLMGRRFATELDTSHGAGALFELFYSSGLYWQFLGFSQVIASLFLLWDKTKTLGAILFFGIISNIFLITVSYEFSGTWIITTLMLLACIWLLFWDWDRLRFLWESNPKPLVTLPILSLKNSFEKTVYCTGFIAGLVFFSLLRGLVVHEIIVCLALIVMILSFIIAVILGIRYRND